MREKVSRMLRGPVATSLIYMILGLCLICMPVDVVNVLCKFIFGVVLIAAGFYHIWIYVQEKANATLIDLFSGGLILVLGIFLFYNPQVVVKLLPVLLGTFILTDSIWVLKGSVKLQKKDSAGLEWKILMLGSIIFVGLGIVMIANPFSSVKVMITFAGCVLLINGISDFIFLFLLKKGISSLINFREKAKAKKEAAAAELKEQEPDYAPWSSRNKQETSDQEEQSDGLEEIKNEGSMVTEEEPGYSGQDDGADTDDALKTEESPEAERQENAQEEQKIEK